MAYVNVTPQPFKLIEGWLQHKGSQDTKWTSYWCVLKDYMIYIFKTNDTTRDNHIGVLSVGSDTQVKIGESDQKKGYRFDLLTAKKLNKFKTAKFIERELWKAYLIGLTEGDISDDLDLTPAQIQKVRSDVQRVISGSSRPPLPVSPRNALDSSSVGTGFSSPDNSITSIFAQESTMDNGGPTIRHKFWPNPDKTDVPSWFFTSITRDTAESILTIGKDYGNSLMRESVTFRETGSYVITKKMEHSRGPPFNHFEVIRVAEGFKINVENAHKTMRCLSEVMDYFVRMSGSAVTRPLVTNDFKILGLDIPDYQTKIWKTQTNAESGEDDVDYRDFYEDPQPTNTPGSHTWGPSRRPSSYLSDNRCGETVKGGQRRPRQRVSGEEIRHSISTTRAIDQLDATLRGVSFGSQGSSYEGHPQVGREVSSESSILPPSVHSRWQNRAKSVPNIQIPPSLEQEVRVSDPVPSLVKPSKTSPRGLPKPPSTGDLQPEKTNAFLKQLQKGKTALKKEPEVRKPLTNSGYRNTWHPRQRLSSRSSSTSCDMSRDSSRDHLTTRDRCYSESETTDDNYDDAIPVNFTDVTFEDLQSTKAQTPTASAEEGPMDRDALKKKLNMMFGGGGGGGMICKKPVTPTFSPLHPPPPHPEEEEEEEYDEIYEHLN